MSDMAKEFESIIRQMTKPELERLAAECRGMGTTEDIAGALEALADGIAAG